jgi:hypothetical protein
VSRLGLYITARLYTVERKDDELERIRNERSCGLMELLSRCLHGGTEVNNETLQCT